LSIFTPNTITSFISDVLDDVLNKSQYPCNYNDIHYCISKLVDKYNLSNILFPKKETPIIFNHRMELIRFIGNCLSEKYTEINLL